MTQVSDHVLDVLENELNTCVVGDILDAIGCYHQFLPPEIRSIGGPASVVGRAMPVLMADVFGPQKRPFGKLTEALDQMDAREVYLATGGTLRCAYWGEILTQTVRIREASGAVIDGYHRDTLGIFQQEWPVFSRGSFGQDSSVRTQVIDYRCPVEIGGVSIRPGDVVFGDVDGILVIPQDREKEVIDASLEKARGEKSVLMEIRNGMSSTEAFEKYGIL
jgi:4-hydroxy-4-methyl-2-oxoglutarate aldolase